VSQQDLVELLGSLEEKGRKDSSGVFTVDVRKLLPKLADYQLARPEQYVLKILQAAVTSGATRVEVRCYGHFVEVDFDGSGLARPELESLFGYVFEDQPKSRHIRHLAIGVTSALAHQARWVQVESRGVKRCWSMLELDSRTKVRRSRLKRGLTRVTLARSVETTITHWWEFLSRKDIYQMLTGGEQAMLPEQIALLQGCRHCPVRLRVNGKRMDRPSFGPPPMQGTGRLLQLIGVNTEDVYHPEHLVAERHLFAGQPAAFRWPPGTYAYRFDRQDTGRHAAGLPAGVTCPALLGIRFSLGWPSVFHYYHAGVLVESLRVETPVPGLVAIVSADDLEVDLSQFGLRDTERLRQRNRWLLTEGLQLAHELRQDPSGVPMPSRVAWALDRLPPV